MTRTYTGLGTSPGTAAAPAWRPRRAGDSGAPVRVTATADQVTDAFATTAAWLDELAAGHRAAGASSYAEILDAEALIVRDPSFAGGVLDRLGDEDAGTALRQVTARLAGAMASVDSPELQERAADIREVGRLVEDRLAGRPPSPVPEGPFVLVAREVSVPDLLAHAEQVCAAVSSTGGPSSHASIIARSLGIPFVVDAPTEVLDVPDGARLLVDGDTGEVVVSPDDERLRRVTAAVESAEALAAARALPARTLDGADVTLLANVASAVEARRALQAGAEGVGLLRTELAHLAASRWPSRAEHERSLRPVLDELAGRPVTVRLLDFTNDKKPPFLAGDDAPPSLALLLATPDALDAQLAALLSVGASVELRVLVPMVERAEDLVAVRSRLAAVAGSLGVDAPPVGAMLETPAAIDALPALVEVGDFFSLGTNDLTAATLHASRSDQAVGPAQAAHPDVLRQVERAGRLTTAAGRPLSVCGDAAADRVVLPLLLGAGLRTLSVAPSRLDAVRSLVRSADVATARALLGDVLAESPTGGLVTTGVSDA